MPRKGHRAASRQAQLRQRRRRGKGVAEEFDAGPSRPTEPAQAPVAEAEPPPTREPAPSPEARPQQVRRSRKATVALTVPSYAYLGSELKRIGLITVLIVAILIVLTFVLSG